MAQPNLSHPLAHNVELPMDSRTPTELVRTISDITSVLNALNGVNVETVVRITTSILRTASSSSSIRAGRTATSVSGRTRA